MTEVRRAIGLAVGAALLASACARSPNDGAASRASNQEGASLAPIDSALTPISKSNPTDRAKLALDACGITNFNPGHLGVVTPIYGIDIVTGMALVSPARNAPNYVPLGYSPLLQSDAAAWIITTSGWTTAPLAPGSIENGTCIVVDGDWGNANWYVTGNSEVGGVITTPQPQAAPVLRLPPLAP